MRKALPSLLALLSLLLTPAAAAQSLFPEALTDNGKEVQSLMTVVAVLATITFLIVFVWLVVVIWRFREGSGHGRATHEKERHSLKLELTWTFIPLVVVLWIGYAAYGSLVQIDHGIDQEDAEVDILVTASQWDWAADYGNAQGIHSTFEAPRTDTVIIRASPDGNSGAVKNESAFVVPANVPIHFNITSSDVIHAWQVIDANRAFVMFIDANPLGANKYNHQTIALPEGWYDVQCNKMCLNPGHAYMRAKIKAVPMGEYTEWLDHQRALVKPVGFVVAERAVTVTSDGFDLANLTVPTKTHLVLDVTNPTGSVVTFSLDGTAVGTEVPANGGRKYVVVDVGTAGAHVLRSSNGGEAAITAVDAAPLSVDLAAFRLDPESISMEAGKMYLITVRNTHSLPHNLFIGHDGHGEAREVLHSSPTVGPGGSDAFLVTAPPAGVYDMWCDVPGHLDSGMHGTVTVT